MSALPKRHVGHADEHLTLKAEDYDFICQMLQTKAGIRLSRNKHSLVENRLKARIKELGFHSFGEYVAHLKRSASTEVPFFLDALTTNTTHFFREASHFEVLKKVASEQFAAGQRRLNVWCAAASTGEEVYTIAMTLEELRSNLPGFDYRILATDISDRVLAATDRGVYSKKEAKGINPHLLRSYFQVNGARDKYRVKPILRDKVKVRRHNLAEDSDPVPMKFDIIFLRNVLIYFPPEIVELVADKMYSALARDGHLFIGHSDSIGERSERFETIEVSVFKRFD